ncbi:hypothetical protein QYE76_040504 [Lolium multiflorum]|uniref:CCHC-type domain-containing protein n=1 Tax=Lolium multiflorum TaxID=4521 RepID=A0AAD8TBV0_LOLMU|nr:hypothetical protein QYE76_040504 [Lolium multiflorum]
MNAGQMMTWEDFKTKFSRYHVPQGLIKKMRDEFRELQQGRMSVVEYRDRFLTLSRYAPDETGTNEKRKERFLNGLHDEMQTVLVNIPFADLEALVDSAIQMEGKLHQANENRKRRMMNQNGPHHTQKYRNNSSGGFTPRYNKPPAQNYRPNYPNNNGGPPKPGGNNNNNKHNNPNNNNNHPNGNHNNPNTAPRTGSNAVPVNPKDKSTVNCYECGVVGHFSNECPKKLARIAANTAALAQQRRFAGRRNQNNNNGRSLPRDATEAQEASRPCQPLTKTTSALTGPSRAQTRPENVHARQDAHAGNPGRDRTPLCPVASRLPSLSPGTNRVATVPSISQTRSPALARPVAVVTDDELPPPYCQTAPKRTTRLHHLWPRHEARQHRLDVANTLRPSLAPSSLWNGDLAVDLPRAPRPPLEPIKGDPSATDFSRQSTPLLSLILHRSSPSHIIAGSRPIAS